MRYGPPFFIYRRLERHSVESAAAPRRQRRKVAVIQERREAHEDETQDRAVYPGAGHRDCFGRQWRCHQALRR